MAVPSAPGVLTKLEQTENDSIENRLSQNFATVPLSALSHSASGTRSYPGRLPAVCCIQGRTKETQKDNLVVAPQRPCVLQTDE